LHIYCFPDYVPTYILQFFLSFVFHIFPLLSQLLIAFMFHICRLWQMRMSMCVTQHWRQVKELWIYMQIQPLCCCCQNLRKDCLMIIGEFVTGIYLY